MTDEAIATGRCTCGAVKYALLKKPLIVHCCHCRWCQRETGAAFALNAMIETSAAPVLQGAPEVIDTPSASGAGQRISRCPTCKVALWSNYGGNDLMRFIRVGTLNTPDDFPPDIHIFTSSKQPWVTIPDVVPAVPEFYRRSEVWSEDALARRKVAMEGGSL